MTKITQEEFVVLFIHQVRAEALGMGGVKLWHMYQREFGCNIPVGRDRFEDIVDKYGLKVRLKLRKPKTTDSTHGLRCYPNLVKDYIPISPNQLWVSDITYLTVWLDDCTYTFCYLSLILDSYTEEIVGWSVGDTLESIYPIRALRMALERIEGSVHAHPIQHSDRGCQYASNEYVTILKSYGIQISMTENGDPKENAQAERINNTIKNELLKGRVFHCIDQVIDAVAGAVAFYNNRRPHMSIDMRTPHEAASCQGEITKRWTSHRLIAIKEKQKIEEITENSLPVTPYQGLTGGRNPEGDP